jgi:hypothetical protein
MFVTGGMMLYLDTGGMMLYLDKEKFIMDFVTTYLAQYAESNSHNIIPSERVKNPPIKEAVTAACLACVHLLEYGLPGPQFTRTEAGEK